MTVVPLRNNEPDTSAMVVTGTFLHADARGEYVVQRAQGDRWRCRKAASCLLQPQAGDVVMLCGSQADGMHLIAVLVQAEAGQTRMEVPQDLVLSVPNGSLYLESAGDIDAQAGRQLQFAAQALHLQAGSAEVRIDRLAFVGKAVSTAVSAVRHIGQVLEQMVDRFSLSTRTSARAVQELDLVRAGQLDYEAGGMMKLHGKATLVTGQDLAKVDAEQIHVG